MIKIGLTGSIGSGKSSVARAASEELGIFVFDADKAVHDLYAQDKDLQAFIVAKCGLDILRDNTVDRQKLAQFRRSEEWKEIEAEVHRRVWKAYDDFVAAQEAKGSKLIICDVPLLFETNAKDRFDYTINVFLPYDVQKHRALARQTPKLTEEEFEKRYKMFIPNEQRNKMADFTIDNSGDLDASLLQLSAHLAKMLDPQASTVSKISQDFNRAAVYVGSFDPITLGHLDTVKKAAKMHYPKLYVAIGVNPDKKPMFTTEERLKMIEREIDREVRPHLPASQEIIVTSYEGMTVDFMKKVGSSLCVRGMRGVKELEEERNLSAINNDLYAKGMEGTGVRFTQAYFAADPEWAHVSSTFARELCKAGRDLDLLDLVSPDVAVKMIEKRDLAAAHGAVTPDELNKLQSLWQEFAPQNGEAADRNYSRMARKYGEAHRKYHTVKHLAEVFALFEENRAAFKNPQAVALALFYHDVIYDIQSSDNEERSAQYASRALAEMGADPQLIARVADLINMTKVHKADAKDGDAALMMDIDMAILGASPARYKEYAAAIEAEYTSHYAPQDYRKRRLQQFLEPCQKNTRLFITDAFERKYGAQSRRNLAWEWKLLKKDQSGATPGAKDRPRPI